MHTLEYSFLDGLIHPAQLQTALAHAPQACRLASFSTIAIPLQSGTDEQAAAEGDALAGAMNLHAAAGERAADISTLLLQGNAHAEWTAFARQLNALSEPVSYPYHQIRNRGKIVHASAPSPETRFAALHKRNRICLETPPHHEHGLYGCDFALVVPKNDRPGGHIHLFAGGGGGIHGGSPALAPRPASWLGLYPCGEAVRAAQHLLDLNAAHGEPDNPRKRRLKSLIATRGLDWIGDRLRQAGFTPFLGHAPIFLSSGEWSGHGDADELLIPVPSGTLADTPGYPLATALQEHLPLLQQRIRLTPQGHLRLHPEDRNTARLIHARLKTPDGHTPLSIASAACRGLPHCKRAQAAASSIKQETAAALDALLAACGLAREPISFRISGCPNGCSRPLFAELALIGRAEGIYDLFAGGSRQGDRTARLLRKALPIAEFPGYMEPLLHLYAAQKRQQPGLTFGNWILQHIDRMENSGGA